MEPTKEFTALEQAVLIYCLSEKAWLDVMQALEDGQLTSNRAIGKLRTKALDRKLAAEKVNKAFRDFTSSYSDWSLYFAAAEMMIEVGLDIATNSLNSVSSIPPAYVDMFLLDNTECLSEHIARYMYLCYHKKTKAQADTKDFDKTLRYFHHSFFYLLKAKHQETIENYFRLNDKWRIN